MTEQQIAAAAIAAYDRANGVGLALSVEAWSRALVYVLRDKTRRHGKDQQWRLVEFARCATLAEVDGAIERRKAALAAD